MHDVASLPAGLAMRRLVQLFVSTYPDEANPALQALIHSGLSGPAPE